MNDDLISRSRLLRDPYFREDRYPVSHHLRMAIMEQPAVDLEKVFKSLPYAKEALEMAKQTVAPVVRCKDCRHRDPEDRRCDHYMGGNTPFARNDNDFCSYGESRVNNAVDIDVAASIAELDFESMTRFAMQQAIKQK